MVGKEEIARIDELVRKGCEKSLTEQEVNELDDMWFEFFGEHLSKEQKIMYQ